MKFDIITLFPDMVDDVLSHSIIKRARESGILKLGFTNPRDFARDRHKTVDARPYGGGPGMVMMAEPLYRAIEKVRKKNSFVVLMCPRGRKFDQKTAEQFSRKKHIVLVCGHYEGVDARINKKVDMELSIGDYVLTGGEIPAAVVADAVARLLPGALKKKDATTDETFNNGELASPQYTRPSVWRRLKVPKELLSGNHAQIAKWRKQRAEEITAERRPDLRKNKRKAC